MSASDPGTDPEPDAAGAALWALWERIDHRDPAAEIDALLGVGIAEATRLAGVAHAASAEVAALIDGLPRLWRRLDQSTTTRLTATTGGIRGPVHWSETMSARSASGGAGDVVVHAEPGRSTDTPLNRLLVDTLDLVRRGGGATGLDLPSSEHHDGDAAIDPPVRARAAATAAADALRHQVLQGVGGARRRRAAAAQDERRARRSRAARRYVTVLAAHDARRNPVSAADGAWLVAQTDGATRARLVLFDAALRAIDARGAVLGPLTARDGGLVTGPVRYAPDRVGRPGVIALGDVLIAPEPTDPAARDRAADALARHDGVGMALLVDPGSALDAAVDLAERRLISRSAAPTARD